VRLAGVASCAGKKSNGHAVVARATRRDPEENIVSPYCEMLYGADSESCVPAFAAECVDANKHFRRYDVQVMLP
jgi:hypothetical protein